MSDNAPKKGEPIFFLDVETLPAEETDPLWVQLSSELKLQKGETPEEFETRKKKIHYDTAMLSPLGRVWMIGYAERSSEPRILAGDGSIEAEVKLLRELNGILEKIDNPWFVGHNISGFDLPFLQVRALKHKLPFLARKLGRYTTKPWDQRVLDTQKIWPRTTADRSSWENGGLRGIARLDTICEVLGVPRQTGVMGPEVYNAYLARDVQGVKDHLYQDITQVREVFKLLWPMV